MNERHKQALESLAAKLDEIGAEMRRIGFWTENPPDLLSEVDAGRIESYLDAPSFELWLQCVLLPRAREGIATDSLTTDSMVGVMAMRQYDYHSHVPDAQGLLTLLVQFDELTKAAASSK
jgi:uncharacterized protein YqcC (DUF446 family)